MRAILAIIVILGIAVAALVMLNKNPETDVKDGRDGSALADRESTFIIINGAEVDTLDPQTASWLTDFRTIECLYEPLLIVDQKTTEVIPGTAEKFDVSADKLTYTFHIRKEAKWSNGDSVTANDYIAGWQRSMLPDYASPYDTIFHHIKGVRPFHEKRKADLAAFAARTDLNNDAARTAAAKQLWNETQAHFAQTVGLKAIDEKTLAVTLERPTPFFAELAGFPSYSPIHKRSYDGLLAFDAAGRAIVEASYFNTSGRPVTNGAFTLAEANFKEFTLMKANPHYWDAKNVGTPAIKVRVIATESSQLLEYQQGNAHWLPDIPTSSPSAAELVSQLRSGKRKDVHVQPGAGTYFYNFNCRKEVDGKPNPLFDKRVRRALSLAIDRKTIVERITRMYQPIAATIVPVGSIPGYEPPVEAGCLFDPEAARKLLAEAGYPGGQGFPTHLKIAYNVEGGHENPAQQIAQTWEKELGIKVGLDGTEKNRMMERWRNHDFTIARGSWYGDYKDPTTWLELFTTGAGHNHPDYSNAAYDKLLADAGNELDAKKRFAILREAEALLLSDQPVVPIYQYVNFHVFDADKVINLDPNPWNTRRLERVRVMKKP